MFFFFGQSLRAVDLFSSARDLMYFARICEFPSAPVKNNYSFTNSAVCGRLSCLTISI
jgi:hypothetical protein